MGPRAEDIGRQAITEQPRFKEPDDEETPRTFKECIEQYEKLCWYNCRVRCAFHKKDWEDYRTDEDKCCYPQLWADECLVDNCHLHEREKTEAHERLL